MSTKLDNIYQVDHKKCTETMEPTKFVLNNPIWNSPDIRVEFDQLNLIKSTLKRLKLKFKEHNQIFFNQLELY